MSSPLGLPDGSVRALLALVLTGTTCYLWGTAHPVPTELLLLNTGVVSYYFASRGSSPTPVAPEAEVVPPVYVPGDDKDNT